MSARSLPPRGLAGRSTSRRRFARCVGASVLGVLALVLWLACVVYEWGAE